jgi:hypothetical protein
MLNAFRKAGYFLGSLSTTTKSLLQCWQVAVAKRIVFPGNKNGVRSWQCGHFNSCLSNPGVMFGTIDFYETGIHFSSEDLVCRYARVHRRVPWDSTHSERWFRGRCDQPHFLSFFSS